MPRCTLAGAAAAGALLLVASCSDQREPVGPSEAPSDAALSPAHSSAGDPAALARGVPGFGGFFIDAQGHPAIYLKDPSQRGRAEQALAPYLRSQGIGAGGLKVLKGDYDWAELEGWFEGASKAALAVPGAVFVDADEASNRVRIGVEPGALGRVRAALARLGMPDAAVIVEERAPVTFAVAQGGPKPKAKPGSGQSLQGVVRPIVGGVQINFPGFLCTLGFNVSGGFVTNSHCTTDQGGVEGTPYWQPTQSASPGQIATEAADPEYTSGLPNCPSGRVCRFSDASRATYASGVTFDRGRIAKTAKPGRSLTITGSFRITSEGSALSGQVVNKVGRTTGWSQGSVTGTCVNTNVSGTNITQLCQTFVSASVGSGDSGSPVFTILSVPPTPRMKRRPPRWRSATSSSTHFSQSSGLI